LSNSPTAAPAEQLKKKSVRFKDSITATKAVDQVDRPDVDLPKVDTPDVDLTPHQDDYLEKLKTFINQTLVSQNIDASLPFMQLDIQMRILEALQSIDRSIKILADTRQH
jgi:hypothetical protein